MQLVNRVNSLVATMLLIVMGTPQLFCSVIFLDTLVTKRVWFPKSILLWLTERKAPDPEPRVATVWLLPASSVTVIEPLRSPIPMGVKVTVIVQASFTANEGPQLCVSLYSADAEIL